MAMKRHSAFSKDPGAIVLHPGYSLGIPLICRVAFSLLAYGLEDLGSIPSRVIPKTFKMVLDTSLFKNQQYKVRIKGKVEQSWERSSTLPYTSV